MKIKFRAKDVEFEQYRYGDLHTQDDDHILIITDDGDYYLILQKTLAQWCYVDADGKEYYSGDIVTKNGRKYKCQMKVTWQEV